MPKRERDDPPTPDPPNNSRNRDQEGSRPSGPAQHAKPAAGLHVVATPIGNLGDITLRALDTLRGADVIACEDTRVTGKLCSRLMIETPLTPYHEHNAEIARPRLLERMRQGQAVALVTDAGTPLVSDPGYRLVRAAHEEGIRVTPLPGASAALAALAVAGLPSDRFLFLGFAPAKDKARRDVLEEVAGLRASLIFYESAQRLAVMLAAMAQVLGQREAVVARELTKLHEEVARGPLGALATRYAESGPPKGEVVIVVGPPGEQAAAGPEDLDRAIDRALETMSPRDAAAVVAKATGLPKRQVYSRILERSG